MPHSNSSCYSLTMTTVPRLRVKPHFLDPCYWLKPWRALHYSSTPVTQVSTPGLQLAHAYVLSEATKVVQLLQARPDVYAVVDSEDTSGAVDMVGGHGCKGLMTVAFSLF